MGARVFAFAAAITLFASCDWMGANSQKQAANKTDSLRKIYDTLRWHNGYLNGYVDHQIGRPLPEWAMRYQK